MEMSFFPAFVARIDGVYIYNIFVIPQTLTLTSYPMIGQFYVRTEKLYEYALHPEITQEQIDLILKDIMKLIRFIEPK